MLRNPFAFIIFLIILSLISLNHGLSASDTSSAQKEQCLICHDSFLKKSKKNIHSAFNIGCESCHIEAPGSSHPEKQYSIKLRYEIPALCFNCHEQSKFNGIDVHSPVAKGMCINCHDPHGSEITASLSGRLRISAISATIKTTLQKNTSTGLRPEGAI